MEVLSDHVREGRLRRRTPDWCQLYKARRPFSLWGVNARYYLVRHGEIVAVYRDLDAVEKDFNEAYSEISQAQERCLDRRYHSKGAQQ
jgi:hypothetical protein